MNTRMITDMIYVKTMKPHYHESELEIILVLEGEVTVYKMERAVNLKEGQFTFINRRIVHYVESEGAYILSTKIKLSQFKDCFDRIEYVEFMTMDEQDKYERPLTDRHRAIVVDQVIKDYTLKNQPELAEEKTFNEKQLVQYLFLSFQLTAAYKKEDGYQNRELTERYYQIVEYISKHIHEKITTEDVLKEVYMNATYFSQFMKKVGGVGFKEFLSYRKLIFINMLLLNESYTLTAIADLVDITDMKAFYLNFKKNFKTSPAKWREKLLSITDDYEVLDDEQVLEQFAMCHNIHRHRENTMSKYYRFISRSKENGVSLENVEILINPYEDMGDHLDKDYQPYKYAGALFALIQNVKAKVILCYPVRLIMGEEEHRLTVDTLKHFVHMNGVNETKKWRVLLQIKDAKELEFARKLEAELEKEIGTLNVSEVLELK